MTGCRTLMPKDCESAPVAKGKMALPTCPRLVAERSWVSECEGRKRSSTDSALPFDPADGTARQRSGYGFTRDG